MDYPTYDEMTPAEQAAYDAAWDAAHPADEPNYLALAEAANERSIENANHWASLV